MVKLSDALWNKNRHIILQIKKDGYEQIAAIFQETADNEKEHAKLRFKLLNGGAQNQQLIESQQY